MSKGRYTSNPKAEKEEKAIQKKILGDPNNYEVSKPNTNDV